MHFVIIGVIVGVFVIAMAFTIKKVYISCNHQVQTGQVLMVVDGHGRRFYKSGKIFVTPIIQKEYVFSLEPFEFDSMIRNLRNREGISFDSRIAAKVRIGEDDKNLELVAERFLNKKNEQITELILEIVRRNFTIYLQEQDLKNLVQDANLLFKNVEESVREDLSKMGLIIESFSILSFEDIQGLMGRLKQ
ncbi:MAG: flotillin family protein [Vulcanimicrobiota bacterium]